MQVLSTPGVGYGRYHFPSQSSATDGVVPGDVVGHQPAEWGHCHEPVPFAWAGQLSDRVDNVTEAQTGDGATWPGSAFGNCGYRRNLLRRRGKGGYWPADARESHCNRRSGTRRGGHRSHPFRPRRRSDQGDLARLYLPSGGTRQHGDYRWPAGVYGPEQLHPRPTGAATSYWRGTSGILPRRIHVSFQSTPVQITWQTLLPLGSASHAGGTDIIQAINPPQQVVVVESTRYP